VLRLPAHVVDLSQPERTLRAPRKLRASDPHTLRPRERRALLALDASADRLEGTVERVVPLVDSRWAVGRRSGPVTLWRVVTVDALERLQHPAWLWASDDWLDPHQSATESFPTPARLPLRTLLAHAAELHPSGRHLIKAMASCVRNLRAGQPTALVVPTEALRHAAHPGRAFVLALLTLMPPAWRAPMWVAVGEPDPRPGQWSFVVTDRAPQGYRLVDIDTPDDEGADLVAFYVRERLLADDPEALEAAAFQIAPATAAGASGLADPWAEAVAATLRSPPEGVAGVDDEALSADPEGAIRALAARLHAGAALDAETGGVTLAEQLVATTSLTRDPRPWHAMLGRPAAQRALAVGAVLESGLRPTAALVEALIDVYPPGAELGPWFDALLRWLRDGVAPATVVEGIAHTLLSWPVAQASSTRASVWSEVVRALVTLGEDEAAMTALTSEVARRIADSGASSSLANLWSVIPEAFRDPSHLDQLVQLIASAPQRDEALVALFQHARGSDDERAALFRAWHTVRASATIPEGELGEDPLYDAVRDTALRREWLDALYATREPVHAADVVAAVSSGSDDPLWIDAEAAMIQAMNLVPAQRFFALPALAGGIDALEPLAPLRLLDAVRRPFPAPEITDIARLMLTAKAPSPLWSLVAVTTAAVDRFDDETVDGAVVDFCATEDLPEEVREVALVCAEQLGAAEGFDPLDHARWMVRISLAPDGSRITPDLTLSLFRGMQSRPDAMERMEAIALELLELPPEHPALLAFVHFLLPRVWDDGVPTKFAAAIPLEAVPNALREAWKHACGAPHAEDDRC